MGECPEAGIRDSLAVASQDTNQAWAIGGLTFGPRCSLQGGREGGNVLWETTALCV